jgi:osmotically-inducible protein OsmY
MRLLELRSLDRESAASTRLPEIDRKAEERFRASSYLALRDISCLASHDVLYLYGRLRSHYLKQVAQELASGVEGARHVVNRIEVVAPTDRARPARETMARQSVRAAPLQQHSTGRVVLLDHTTDERSQQRC